jgi:hypothetical protein
MLMILIKESQFSWMGFLTRQTIYINSLTQLDLTPKQLLLFLTLMSKVELGMKDLKI